MKTLLIATTLLLSTGASALTQKIHVDLNNAVLQGHEMVPLKRMIARQHGGGTLRGFNIVQAKVEAKSKMGQGEISLRIGHSESYPQVVPGTPENFDSDYSGFTTLTLKANSYRGQDSRGPLQLLTSGLIKLDDVEITAMKKLRYDHTNTAGLLFSMVKEFKAQKVVGSTKSIKVNGMLSGIMLECTKEKVRVNEVVIKFTDGQKVIIDEIDGKLKKGHVKQFALKGMLAKPVHKVTVTATSTKIFGSRGKLAVHLAR